MIYDLNFSGGAENLFDNIKSRPIELDGNKTCEYYGFESNQTNDYRNKFNWFFVGPGKIRDFLIWIKENLLRERPELFIQDDSV